MKGFTVYNKDNRTITNEFVLLSFIITLNIIQYVNTEAYLRSNKSSILNENR